MNVEKVIFLKEYEDLLKKTIKLSNYLANWDNLKEQPLAPFKLFNQQSMVMHQYLQILEWRAEIEGFTEIYDIQRKYITGEQQKRVCDEEVS